MTAVGRAFDLIGGKTIGWYELYDLIDGYGRRAWDGKGGLGNSR